MCIDYHSSCVEIHIPRMCVDYHSSCVCVVFHSLSVMVLIFHLCVQILIPPKNLKDLLATESMSYKKVGSHCLCAFLLYGVGSVQCCLCESYVFFGGGSKLVKRFSVYVCYRCVFFGGGNKLV